MRIKDWTLPYAIFYTLFYFGTRLFYRKVKKIGVENIPKGKPMFFVANHQNSLMDPVAVSISVVKPPFSLGRADVFKHPISGPILRAVKSLPIYRKKDGYDFKKSNKKTFDSCHKILSENGSLMIFPEGSHNIKKRLRSLKSGVSVIIDGALEKYKNLDIQIVPVGLNYSNSVNKNADFLVRFGKPIPVSNFSEIKGKERTLLMMQAIEEGIKKEMTDFSEEEFYNLYHYLCFDGKFIAADGNLEEEFRLRKQKSNSITEFVLKNKKKAKEALSLAESNLIYCQKEKIKPYLFDKENYNLLLNYVILLIWFPVFLYGAINNIILFVLPSFIHGKIKDKQFVGPVNILAGTVIGFLSWLTQVVLVAYFTNNYIWILYLISLPISGKIAYAYLIFWKKTRGKRIYNKLSKKNSEKFKTAKKNYLQLKKLHNKL